MFQRTACKKVCRIKKKLEEMTIFLNSEHWHWIKNSYHFKKDSDAYTKFKIRHIIISVE